MCDNPVPCACTLEKRQKLRTEHIERSQALRSVAFRLAGQMTDAEVELLYGQAQQEWDDAIHIASPDDPLRSLCGSYGRNLCDLPERPNGVEGCLGCLQRAEVLAPAPKELVTA